jgi:hypothetical protein
MEGASPPVDGYGELARRALAHSEWPSDTQPAARSLAALFSKLDRGIELEWLADRGAVQRTLALVLGCPVEWVRRAVTPDSEDDAPTRLRFDDLPYARPFDLRQEPLPPGLPVEVLRPSSWARLWWLAPSGSGRTLAGRWLAARGLARCPGRRQPGSAEFEGGGPVYIELEQANDVQVCAGLPERGVCVAAPFAPPAGASPGWQVVTAPPLLSSLPALLAWIEARVPEDGAFEAAAAEAWLRPWVSDASLPTLGAVLGAAGVLDARGLREASGKSLLELAESFVSERLEAASVRGSAEAQWLERHGFGALVQLAQSALTTADEPWGVARSLDEWMALVPAELANGVDSEWVRWSVARSGGQASMRVVERALRDVPPNAYRLVRALVNAALLVERAPGRLRIVPGFLEHAALARAREALLSEAPIAWGEALLRPHASASLLEALYRRCAADDFEAIERVAEQEVSFQPALVVASEAALVCLGLRALSGAQVPLESLESVWNEQLACLVELPGELPRPRLLCGAPPPLASAGSTLSRHAVWMLALLAASELLGEHQGRAHPLLRPWRARPSLARLRPMLDAIYAELGQPELAAQAWAVEAFALVGRLLDDEDDLEHIAADDGEDVEAAEPEPLHPLSRPAQLARALASGGFSGEWLDDFGAHPLELPALEAACAARHLPWSRCAHAVWKAWQNRGCPAQSEGLLGPGSVFRERFWPHLPPEVLAAAWPRWVASAQSWPFELFGPSQWAAFVDLFVQRWLRAPDSGVWRAAFVALPRTELQRAVQEGRLLDGAAGAIETRPLLELAWQRLPAWLGAELRGRANGGDARAVAGLLAAVPHEVEDEVVQLLCEELSRRSTQRAVIDSGRAWLFAKISARRSDWRAAYALFDELEARLARAERVRSVFDTRAPSQEP